MNEQQTDKLKLAQQEIEAVYKQSKDALDYAIELQRWQEVTRLNAETWGIKQCLRIVTTIANATS